MRSPLQPGSSWGRRFWKLRKWHCCHFRPFLILPRSFASKMRLRLGNVQVKSHDSWLLTRYRDFWKESQSQESSNPWLVHSLGDAQVKSHDSWLLTCYGYIWRESQSQESSNQWLVHSLMDGKPNDQRRVTTYNTSYNPTGHFVLFASQMFIPPFERRLISDLNLL